MPKIRVRSSKPSTKGSYSQGRKLGKERNHSHELITAYNTKGRKIEYCKVPTCKKKRLVS